MNQIMRLINQLKGFRTLFVNILLTIMPILEMSEMLDVLPDNYEAPYAIMIALVNLYLRSITTTPLGKS
ncbi:MAG: hypothetical protein JJ858_08085 [Rhizobiaceae bacterium]|nr:hypothetical protein [Rhizobiaceae bacterium]